MEETYVRLLCPECTKSWTTAPKDLPPADDQFRCPDCTASRHTAEFLRTEHDLEALKQFH